MRQINAQNCEGKMQCRLITGLLDSNVVKVSHLMRLEQVFGQLMCRVLVTVTTQLCVKTHRLYTKRSEFHCM